tara:strand:- start:883 stop:1191 length:309 start_codon:yes stop_codon:yes gene_type:complete
MRITARVEKLLELQSGTTKAGKQWKKQPILVSQKDEFHNELLIEMWNDNIMDLNEGQNYEFDIVIKSREWNGKYYTNVSCNNVSSFTDDESDINNHDNFKPF